jgi:hypothetical protein
MEQTLIEQSLIQISRYRFSLVISGLTKMLQRVNEIVSISENHLEKGLYIKKIYFSINPHKDAEDMTRKD